MTDTRLPFFVPLLPLGSEETHLRNLERLARDLRRYAATGGPDEDELATAPSLRDWVCVPDGGSCRLAGVVSSHPRVGPGPGTTSPVHAVAHDLAWVRTHNRLWRLGPAAGRIRRGDA